MSGLSAAVFELALQRAGATSALPYTGLANALDRFENIDGDDMLRPRAVIVFDPRSVNIWRPALMIGGGTVSTKATQATVTVMVPGRPAALLQVPAHHVRMAPVPEQLRQFLVSAARFARAVSAFAREQGTTDPAALLEVPLIHTLADDTVRGAAIYLGLHARGQVSSPPPPGHSPKPLAMHWLPERALGAPESRPGLSGPTLAG